VHESGGSRKAVILRLSAQRDIDEAIDFYVAQGAPETAHVIPSGAVLRSST